MAKFKEEVYYSDGSWRDIYVCNTTKDDWNKWIDLVNQKYLVSFYNGQTQKTETAINKQAVFDYWDGKTDYMSGATIKLGNIEIKSHFFWDKEIENDIDPSEIVTIADHKLIFDYLVDIYQTLNKKVLLTAENLQDVVYIEIDAESVQIEIE